MAWDTYHDYNNILAYLSTSITQALLKARIFLRTAFHCRCKVPPFCGHLRESSLRKKTKPKDTKLKQYAYGQTTLIYLSFHIYIWHTNYVVVIVGLPSSRPSPFSHPLTYFPSPSKCTVLPIRRTYTYIRLLYIAYYPDPPPVHSPDIVHSSTSAWNRWVLVLLRKNFKYRPTLILHAISDTNVGKYVYLPNLRAHRRGVIHAGEFWGKIAK